MMMIAMMIGVMIGARCGRILNIAIVIPNMAGARAARHQLLANTDGRVVMGGAPPLWWRPLTVPPSGEASYGAPFW